MVHKVEHVSLAGISHCYNHDVGNTIEWYIATLLYVCKSFTFMIV